MSGGMRQRAMIAWRWRASRRSCSRTSRHALTHRQIQILLLFAELQARVRHVRHLRDHDIGVAIEICDRVP